MRSLQELYLRDFRDQWHSNYATRPGKLFPGVDVNLTISLLAKGGEGTRRILTSGYRRWSDRGNRGRKELFHVVGYAERTPPEKHANPFPKIASPLEWAILGKCHESGKTLKDYRFGSGRPVYYHSGGRYWRKAVTRRLSSHYRPFPLREEHRPAVLALLNSQFFYWYWIVNSNCMDLVSREVDCCPVFPLEKADGRTFGRLVGLLLDSYVSHGEERTRRGGMINTRETNFDVKKSKPIIDKIDGILARHYGFTQEELDFIVNYDVKYRMGRDLDAGIP
jgi:hypothetical protein